MNLYLLEQWNKVVKPNDVIVIAGDFAWSTKQEEVESRFISKLNGNKIFLKGNHDHWWKGERRHIYKRKVGGLKFMVCHYPFRSWIHGYNLHGHCHGTLPPWRNQLDVGVDNAKLLVGEYRPLSWIEAAELIEQHNKEIINESRDYHAGQTDNPSLLVSQPEPQRAGGHLPVRQESSAEQAERQDAGL